MLNIFYWFFYPELATAEWNQHMLMGILHSVGFIALGILVYAFLPYNRKYERLKFGLTNLLIFVLALIYVIRSIMIISNEICRTNYKLTFVFNHLIATFVYGILAFWLISYILGAKKYFANIFEYVKLLFS